MMDEHTIRIQSIPYSLDDLGRNPTNYVQENGIDYSQADALKLSQILKGALVLSEADKLAVLAVRRAEEKAKRAREQAFADRHPDWGVYLTDVVKVQRRKAHDAQYGAMEAEIERRLRAGMKYVSHKEIAMNFHCSTITVGKCVKDVRARLENEMIGR